jgi:hypothetical protein
MVIVDLQYVEVTEESMVEGGYSIADAIASASALSTNLFGSATTFTSNTTSAIYDVLTGLSAATSNGSSSSSAF